MKCFVFGDEMVLNDDLCIFKHMEIPSNPSHPQAFESKALRNALDKSQLTEQVILAPNPCTIRVNEVVIGVCNTDILMHMNKSGKAEGKSQKKQMFRTLEHLVKQNSFFPLFPPPPEARLDLMHMAQIQMPVRPDILVTPSKLVPFVGPLCEYTLCVNPGKLARGGKKGYAQIVIHPMSKDVLEARDHAEKIAHHVPIRTKVIQKRMEVE